MAETSDITSAPIEEDQGVIQPKDDDDVNRNDNSVAVASSMISDAVEAAVNHEEESKKENTKHESSFDNKQPTQSNQQDDMKDDNYTSKEEMVGVRAAVCLSQDVNDNDANEKNNTQHDDSSKKEQPTTPQASEPRPPSKSPPSKIASPVTSINNSTPPSASRSSALLVYEGPPNEDIWKESGHDSSKCNVWPPGWIKRVYERRSGNSKGHRDRYWYSPDGKKFRSMIQIRQYLEKLETGNGGKKEVAENMEINPQQSNNNNKNKNKREHNPSPNTNENINKKKTKASGNSTDNTQTLANDRNNDQNSKSPKDANDINTNDKNRKRTIDPMANNSKQGVSVESAGQSSSSSLNKALPHVQATMPQTAKVTLRPNTICVFSTIPQLALTLQQANPMVPVVDLLLNIPPTATTSVVDHLLSPDALHLLSQTEILVTEPILLRQLLAASQVNLTRLRWCQSTFAGVDALFPLPDNISNISTDNSTNPKKKHSKNEKDGGSIKNNNSNSTKQNVNQTPSFVLTRFAGFFGPPMAEWCLGRIIAHERHFEISRNDQQRRAWAGSPIVYQYRPLSSLTLVILGCCGDIGMHVARGGKAFGMRVVGFVRPERAVALAAGGRSPFVDEYITCLRRAFQQADYIVSILPSTHETRGLITLEVLENGSREPPHGGKCPVFINVGRGDVINDQTLMEALNRNYLSAAILDVTNPEPLPPTHPLWHNPKVTISPHVSALTRVHDVPHLVLQNYTRYINKRPLLFTVDWQKTY